MSVLDEKIEVLTELIGEVCLPNVVGGIDATYRGGLDTVQALRMIAATAESAQREAVDLARAEGASWEQIAKALGVTRQSAHERFAYTLDRA